MHTIPKQVFVLGSTVLESDRLEIVARLDVSHAMNTIPKRMFVFEGTV